MESEGLWDITGDVQKAVCVELRRVMGAGESGDLSREELFTATGVVETSRKGRGKSVTTPIWTFRLLSFTGNGALVSCMNILAPLE